jgi:PAS domain S-box-containing protein
MTGRRPKPLAPQPLRRRAQTRLRQRQASPRPPREAAAAANDTRRLFHELQVHQIELELQNEELQKARGAMEASLAKYSELYDFAPVGYFTLNREGAICECNLAGASLLGPPRSALLKRRFATFIAAEDRANLAALLRRVFDQAAMQEGDLRLPRADGTTIDIRIRCNLSAGSERCQMAVVDVTQRRLAERAEIVRRQLELMTAANQVLETEIGRRRKAEVALKASELRAQNLLAESQTMQRQLREYSRRILRVQEDQRAAISRDLHDRVGQLLVAINIHLAAFADAAVRQPQSIKASINPIVKLLQESAEHVHEFARELRPASLDDLGLIPALAAYLRAFRQRRDFQIEFAAFEGVETMDADKRMVLYRVVQEALTNVVKHAKATRVNVSIFKAPGGVCLEISDNGKSFNARQLAADQSNQRLGMIGMRERVEMVGGRFHVASKAGQGTTVQAEIPFAAAEPGTVKPAVRPPAAK